MQISIIIPAYNAAKYLNRCIESVANQDLPYDCYEVIVVNDGSTDDTVTVLDSLCGKYSFLRYVTTSNGGLSRARNRGLAEAVGEYFLFLDSDDSIVPNALGRIYEKMSGGKLDMMLMNYVHIASDNTYLEIPYHMDRNIHDIVSGKEFLLVDCYPPMVWIYIYRHTFLKEHALKMIPIWHEDEEFTPRAICLAQRIRYVPFTFYNYYQNSGSYMNQYNESHALNMIAAMESLNRFSATCREDKEVRRYFNNHIAVIVMRLFKNSIRSAEQGQDKMIEALKRGDLLPLKPQKKSFYYWIFNLSPLLFVRFYRILKHNYKSAR